MEVKVPLYWFVTLTYFRVLSYVGVNDRLLKKMRFTRKAIRGQPTFDERMPLRIRTIKGAVAFLTCIVKNIGNESVSWIRNQDLQILTVNDYVFTGDSRFDVSHDETENWTLKINDVRLEDNGIYECQISTQPVTSFLVYLSVTDINAWNNSVKNVEKEAGFDLINDDIGLPVVEFQTTTGPNSFSTKILEGTEICLKENNSLRLTCEIDINTESNGSPSKTEAANVIFSNLLWFHNDKIINQNSSHEGTLVRTTVSSNTIQSSLIILRAYVNDSGVYICHPHALNEAAIMVHISNGVILTHRFSIFLTPVLLVVLNIVQNIFKI